jgi:hypothetical protein
MTLYANTKPLQTVVKPDHFGGVFTPIETDRKKLDKEEEKKVKAIATRLRNYGIENICDDNVEYALRAPSSKGDPEAAFRLLMLLEETYEGIVRPFDPGTKLLGAENRGNVTCFLDALLFGMFARLDSFEAMLYESFEDPQRRKLAGFLRLWVNLLRSGRLITTDVTKHLQDALAECGWKDAANLRQQDPSEAFGFITGQLELPLLTLKMDLFHTGKEDPADDHKFVNERLLEVAIPEEPSEGNSVITLEDCLEHYFNNRIEVKRHMEQQRRNTLQGSSKVDDEQNKAFDNDSKVESGLHVEVAEVPDTPIASTPIAEAPSQLKSSADKLRPGSGRKRADSIFSQRKVTIEGVDPNKALSDDSKAAPDDKLRRMSTRTEVLMPAWQFFKLLPWYTDHMPTSDAQVAAHFSRKRPVLGIALKRYSYTNEGAARRRDTFVDIPLEIAVPNFVSDDSMRDEGPLVGNFRLVLQSVICHRGVSVHSGHYVCLSRGSAPNAARKSTSERRDSNSSTPDFEDPWMRFDDLAKERVSYVNIHDALRQETPYLLFYQVQPIGEDGHAIHDLPSYAEATSRSQSDAMPFEKSALIDDIFENDSALQQAFPRSTETADFGVSSARNSLEIDPTSNTRGRTSRDQRRSSVVLEGSSFGGSVSGSIGTATTASVPATPVEEKGNAFLSVAKNLGTRRSSKPSKSRPTSTGPVNPEKEKDKEASRFSLNMSKLSLRMSRADLKDLKDLHNAASTSNGNGGGSNSNSNSPLSATQSSELLAAEAADPRDNDMAPPPSYVPSVPASEDGHTDAASKEIGASPKKSPPAATGKGKKDKESKKKHGHSHSHTKSGHEDRDCVVM